MDIGRQLPLPGPGHYEPLSDSGAHHWSIVATLIQSAKLNDIDPLVWLADVLPRIADQPASCLADLLPRNWKPATGHGVRQMDIVSVGTLHARRRLVGGD
jgi:hypothetical protein